MWTTWCVRGKRSRRRLVNGMTGDKLGADEAATRAKGGKVDGRRWGRIKDPNGGTFSEIIRVRQTATA